MNDAHNPFSPPRAEMSSADREPDSEAPASRPTAVSIALFLMGVEILLAIAGIAAEPYLVVNGGVKPGYTMPVTVLDAALMAVLVIFVARGRNWARIMFL